jgi:hypothetical protein
LEEAQAKGFAETTKRMLVLEANLRDLELREDILAKEKHKLLQELDKAKRRVEEADTILEGKLRPILKPSFLHFFPIFRKAQGC